MEAAMLLDMKKQTQKPQTAPRGATPEPDTRKLLAMQERRRRKCKLGNHQPRVLCRMELPSSWEPTTNNARYQMWAQKRGATA